jgi:hypothetical protein
MEGNAPADSQALISTHTVAALPTIKRRQAKPMTPSMEEDKSWRYSQPLPTSAARLRKAGPPLQRNPK